MKTKEILHQAVLEAIQMDTDREGPARVASAITNILCAFADVIRGDDHAGSACGLDAVPVEGYSTQATDRWVPILSQQTRTNELLEKLLDHAVGGISMVTAA